MRGDSASGTSISGDLAFAAVAARTSYGRLADGGHDLGFVTVTMMSHVQLCETEEVTHRREYLELVLGVPRSSNEVIVPGTYEVDGVHPLFSADGGVQTARLTIEPDAGLHHVYRSTGTITLAQVDPTGTRGSFDVVFEFDDGGTGTLSGTFDAPVCD